MTRSLRQPKLEAQDSLGNAKFTNRGAGSDELEILSATLALTNHPKWDRSKINWRGHSPLVELHSSEQFMNIILPDSATTAEEMRTLLQAFGKRTRLDRFVPIGTLMANHDCNHCGTKLSLESNGGEVRAVSKCELPKGVYPFTVDIRIPSGKLVFGEHLSSSAPSPKTADSRQAVDFSERMKSIHYAQHGFVYCYLGSGYGQPHLVKKSNGSVSVVSVPYPILERRGHEPYNEGATLRGHGKVLGSLTGCRLEGMDYDAFKKIVPRGQKIEEYLRLGGLVVVDLAPGVYRLTHGVSGQGYMIDYPAVFEHSTLERVGN